MKASLNLLIIIGCYFLVVNSGCANYGKYLGSNVPFGVGEYSFFTWGIDVFTNNTLTSETIKCIENTGNYKSIGLYLGLNKIGQIAFDPTKYSSSAIQAFFDSKLKKQIILNINLNLPNVYQTVLTTLVPIISHLNKIDFLWLRTNMDPDCYFPTLYANCQTDLTLNQTIALLENLAQYIKDLGFKVGIYTNEDIWATWLNGTDYGNLGNVPLMYDGSDFSEISTGFESFSDFGPWDAPESKMTGYWYLDSNCCWPGQLRWNPSETN